MRTTFEEAKTCPRCNQYGVEVYSEPGPRNSTVYVFNCVTEGCRWYQTGWTVQVMADGSIPTRSSKGEKDFPNFTPGQEEMAKQYLEQLQREGKETS